MKREYVITRNTYLTDITYLYLVIEQDFNTVMTRRTFINENMVRVRSTCMLSDEDALMFSLKYGDIFKIETAESFMSYLSSL